MTKTTHTHTHTHTHTRHAFTLIEALLILLVLAFFLLLAIMPSPRAKERAKQVNCINNQMIISRALRLRTLDGTGATNAIDPDYLPAYFQIHSNELARPNVLVCPADKARTPAASFTSLNNSNINYFLSADLKDDSPQMFLSGDSNLLLAGTNIPSGLVTLFTNSPVAWDSTRHKNQGIIALVDGSVQGFTSARLRAALQSSATQTNRLILP